MPALYLLLGFGLGLAAGREYLPPLPPGTGFGQLAALAFAALLLLAPLLRFFKPLRAWGQQLAAKTRAPAKPKLAVVKSGAPRPPLP